MKRKEFLTSLLAASSLPLVLQAADQGAENKAIGEKARIPICAFSKNFQWLDPSAMAELAGEIGFDGIDLTVRPGGHVLPSRVTVDLPSAVEAIEKAGLKVFMLTTAISDAQEKGTRDILAAASALGIRYYRMAWYNYDQQLDVLANIHNCKARFSALSDINNQYKIHGAYQNHAGNYFGASVWDLWMALQGADPAYMGCQYDIRHATVEATGSWAPAMQLIQPCIKTIAIKDFTWIQKNNQWQAGSVPLGEGMVDYRGYLQKLKQYHFSGPISLHCEYPLGGAEDGATRLSIPQTDFVKAVKKDLLLLRSWLKENDI